MMQEVNLMPLSASSDDPMLLAVFVATLLHAGILLGINFKMPEPPKVSKSIEVTLSHAPLKKAPKQAKYLASDHQLGAGDRDSKPKPLTQRLPSMPSETISERKAKANKQAPKGGEKATPQKVVVHSKALASAATANETVNEVAEVEVEEAPKLTAEALQHQIAQLGERIRNSQESAQDSKIKFVKSVATHKYLAAQYVKDWEDKVERTGNLNYPEAARNQGRPQTLTMDVGIKADGGIYSIRIARSSGNPALDEAAKRIVKMSAPFAALPADLLKEVNVLVITRIWKFSDETGMTTR
ncbi:MAG: energy transducer TonB [Gammaproteobacteria bacterium]